MALIYEYDDNFVIDSIDSEKVDKAEADAIIEVDLLNVTTEPFREKMVTATVYMVFCMVQLEAEGMQEKHDGYSKQYNKAYSLSKTSSPTSVSNIPLLRG